MSLGVNSSTKVDSQANAWREGEQSSRGEAMSSRSDAALRVLETEYDRLMPKLDEVLVKLRKVAELNGIETLTEEERTILHLQTLISTLVNYS